MPQHRLGIVPTAAIPKDPPDLWVRARLLWHRLGRQRRLQRYAQEADGVLALLADLTPWSDEQIDAAIAEHRHRIARRKRVVSRQNQLFCVALLAELARRTLGQTPYRVQLLAVLALADDHLVQVAPGEGKTLTLALVAVLRGWAPKPCHVITANEYLAQRDAELLRPLFNRAGVQVAVVRAEDAPEQKQQAYAQDVVYATAKQLVADHLIDRVRFGGAIDRLGVSLRLMAGTGLPPMMQRGLGSAIVDEADYVLIDEAITPMIISEPEANAVLREAVLAAQAWVGELVSGVHYTLDVTHRDVQWLPAGEERLAELALVLPAQWRGRQRREDLLAKAVLARDFFHENQHYVCAEGKVVIVDEGTGRSMPGRSWSYGLHQAIEAKAGVELTDPSRTRARLSFQNFFKLYDSICGASGTLQHIDYELCFNYGALTLEVPPRIASKMQVHPLVLVATAADRLKAVVKQVSALQHRAVLLGTRSVADSEQVAAALAAEGLSCQVLNAKNPAEEADIVARAGVPGRITVATNMAGRGTDIQLSPEVIAQGGLCVVMFEPNASARIDAQLYGRSARQGQPGEVFPFASREDELFQLNLPRGVLRMLPLRAELLIRLAQYRAERRAFRQRRLLNRANRESQERLTFTNA